MNLVVLEVLNLAKKLTPFLFNDNEKTRFDLSAALNLALIAVLVWMFGFDTAKEIIEMSKS